MSIRTWLRGLTLAVATTAITLSVAQTPQNPPDPGTQAPPTPQAPQANTEARIRLLLSGYDSFPTADELRAVSPAAPAFLMQIAQDKTALPTLRNRAIDALGYFDEPEVKAFLTVILTEPDTAPEMGVHKAITALMKLEGEDGLGQVSPFLQHEDVQLRLTAVEAIGNFGGRGGRVLLEERRKIEPSKMVKDKIKPFL